MPALADDAFQWLWRWQQEQRVPGMAVVVSDRTQTLHIELAGLADEVPSWADWIDRVVQGA